MKKQLTVLLIVLLSAVTSSYVFSQKKLPGKITASALESHVTFLASPLLKGRMNGEEGLEIAAGYLATQAGLLGLKPANGDIYYQPFTVIRKLADQSRSGITIFSSGDSVAFRDPFQHIIPQGPADIDVEGEVVFAGYGIRSEKHGYNDLENLDIKGKVVLVMDRAPLGKDGKPVFDEPGWDGAMSLQMKLGPLLSPGPKAILFVPDPKSGYRSYGESTPGLTAYLSTQMNLKGDNSDLSPIMSLLPKVIFINRSVADEILKGSGKTLTELQAGIDETFKPNSFAVEGKKIRITERVIIEEKVLNNVAAYIEGSHPVLKDEVIIFSAHYDHIGAVGNKVNTGADDDASGCAALLAMADEFMSLRKKPLRSILFLWVAGEEIGLYGSQSYLSNPLFPLGKTVANLNMDMIGRVKEPADSTSETPMTGAQEVYVITDGQSSNLRAIAEEADSKSRLDFDYSLSGRDHPLQLFSRSDHFNFVKKDIPVLFFTTGIHTDYHTPGDIVEKINFEKLELVTRTMYEIGHTVANRKTRINVDNPFSTWGKDK